GTREAAMRTHLFVASAAACVCSIALSAQAPTTSTQKSSDTRITVTGCVERADQLAGNAATTTVDSLSFVLIKPEPTKPTGTTGSNAAAPTPTAQPHRMSRLDGKAVDLDARMGQEVGVAATGAEAATAPAGATSSTEAPRVNVES